MGSKVTFRAASMSGWQTLLFPGVYGETVALEVFQTLSRLDVTEAVLWEKVSGAYIETGSYRGKGLDA